MSGIKEIEQGVRIATSDDFAAILELDTKVGKEYFSRLLSARAFAEIFAPDKVARKVKYAIEPKSQQRLFLYMHNGMAIGYVICGPKLSFQSQNEFDEKNSHIGMISPIRVLSDYRNQGIGKKLIQKSFDYLLQIGMEKIISRTLANNLASHKFYDAINGKQKAKTIVQVGAEKLNVIIYEWVNPYRII